MPSGARKRKAAAKKKMKNGDAHNNSSNNSSINSSSTHSQGSEDPRSLDDRESDSSEIEREEEARGEGEAVDHEEGLSKGNAENTREGNLEKNGSGDVDVEEETPIVILTGEDKEVAVEEEKPEVAELEELKAVDVNSVLETHEIPKQDAIAVEGASVELVKDIVSLSQEMNVGFGSSVTSDLVESGLITNADLASPISDENARFSSISQDLQSEEVESKIVSMNEGKSSVDPNPSSGSETSSAPAVTTTQVVDCVTNNETLQQSDKQAGSTVVSTTSEVDNVKEISTQKRSMDQTSTGINPLPVQRTSMMGCCGLFELFSSANK